MNISRDAVLEILEKLKPWGTMRDDYVARVLEEAQEKIKQLPEGPGMDSALRKAMEENWSGGPKCQAWLPTADGKRQCGNRATQKILFLVGTWGIAKCLEKVLATLERIEKQNKP